MPLTTSTASTSPSPVAPDPPLAPITVPMFQAMIRAGIIAEKDPIYLWKGRLARRMARNRPHTIAVGRARHILEAIVPDGYHVQQEQPVAWRREPTATEPDLAILRGRPEDYPEAFPTTADMPMAIEVADTSLPTDRRQAADLSREGVPVYGIINLRDRRLELYDDLQEDTYRRLTTYAEDDDAPILVDGRAIGRVRVRDLLP